MNVKNHLFETIFESGYLNGSHYEILESDSLIIMVDMIIGYLVEVNNEVFIEA